MILFDLIQIFFSFFFNQNVYLSLIVNDTVLLLYSKCNRPPRLFFHGSHSAFHVSIYSSSLQLQLFVPSSSTRQIPTATLSLTLPHLLPAPQLVNTGALQGLAPGDVIFPPQKRRVTKLPSGDGDNGEERARGDWKVMSLLITRGFFFSQPAAVCVTHTSRMHAVPTARRMHQRRLVASL